MEVIPSKSEQRLHGAHELQMRETEKAEQNDRKIAMSDTLRSKLQGL